MNQSDAIEALRKTHRDHDWSGPVMGSNSLNDFILGAGAYPPSDDIADAIREAVRNRISSALSNKSSSPDEAWTAWCMGKIAVDFFDIQLIVDDID